MYENRIMKPIEIILKEEGGEKRKSNSGGEFFQSPLYV
jgi:hypothetical protein